MLLKFASIVALTATTVVASIIQATDSAGRVRYVASGRAGNFTPFEDTDTIDNALSVKRILAKPPVSHLFELQLANLNNNPPGRFLLGASEGVGSQNHGALTGNSGDYAVLNPTGHTAANAPPAPGPGGFTFASSIWIRNPTTRDLTVRYVNPDGSVNTDISIGIWQDGSSGSRVFILTGNRTLFEGRFGAATWVTFNLQA